MKDSLKILKNLSRKYPRSRIYVFGSYAWGRPRKDSDLDIAIDAPDVLEYFNIRDDLENSNIPKTMDILWLNTLDNINLKERIYTHGKQI